MKLAQRLNLIKQAATGKTANSYDGVQLARDFRRYGPQMMGDFSQTVMSDQDKYTGYMYGAINKVANRVAMLAEGSIRTAAAETIVKAAKEKRESVRHPYLDVIDNSDDFSDDDLWREIQTYLGLKGVYYLGVIRAKSPNGAVIGTPQEFKSINPYDVTRVLNEETLKVDHYVENVGGLVRRWEPHQIIEFRLLNPFDRREPYAPADAAKDAQFQLKQGGDQIRNTIRRNNKFPGAIMINSGDLVMNDQELKNFRARILGKTDKDEPIFVEGKGMLDWQDMQVDLKKSMPTEVNEIGLNQLIAVTGVSKTMFGIEQSGTTRDTAKVQVDQFVADISMPALKIILGVFNQDYKRNYQADYKKTQYKFKIDSPLGKDRDSELKDVEIRGKSFEVYNDLVNKGYDRDLAARYVEGEVTLEELGEPTNEPVQPVVPATATDPTQDEPKADPNAKNATQALTHVHNAIDREAMAKVYTQALKDSVIDVQRQLVASVTTKVTRNAYDSQSDIIDDEEKRAAIAALVASVTLFYLATMPVVGQDVVRERTLEFADLVLTASPQYVIDKEVRNYIEETAKKAASSHVNTILDDLLESVRKAALEGVSRDDLVSTIRKEFSYISTQRADVIAQSETYRAFNRAQYDADREFLESIGKTKQAYKKWETHSDNPCPFCQALAAEGEVAFGLPFRELGDTVEATFTRADGTSNVRKMAVDYEELRSGNAHPRCQCDYRLIIREA